MSGVFRAKTVNSSGTFLYTVADKGFGESQATICEVWEFKCSNCEHYNQNN